MMRLFKRRDTRAMALVAGFACGMPCLVFAAGTPSWSPLQPPVALAACFAAAALVTWLRRGLPPDTELVWLSTEEQDRLAGAGPPPDRALLYVALRRDWGRRYRMDLFVDDRHVGQLRPGTGLLLPLRPGLRQMRATLGSQRHAVSETVNALPGTLAGFAIRSWGSRSMTLEIKRLPGTTLSVPRAEVRLVRPAVPEA